MSHALAELYRHNLWANLKLLDACETLSDDQLDAVLPGTYGSVRSTLVHLFSAEERYLTMLRGEPASPPREKEGFPGFDTLRERATASGEALIGYAEGYAEGSMLSGTWGSQRYTMPATVPLIQAIHHATEHRTHIATVLGTLGIEPPDIDGWSYGGW